MKKRVIFCLFLSIYLIYTHKDSFLIKIEELPYVNFLFRVIVDMFVNIFDYFSLKNPEVTGEQYKNIEKESFPIYKEKILKTGFDFEEHKIMTEDGYILTAWRIPGKIKELEISKKSRKPIILQHGLLDTSYTWIMLKNTTDSLPIIMADKGFDVWMTNSRGNLFSKEHTNPEYDSNKFYSKYWDFSFHEMAMYDVTANVFYIKNITGFEKLSYVGHSQGTVQYFIQYTMNPTFIEENIDKFVAIGTVVNVFNTTSTIVHILEKTGVNVFLEKLYIKNIFNSNFLNNFISFACRNINSVCSLIVQFFIEDYSTGRIDYNELLKDFYYVPGGTSNMNVHHWAQLYASKQFKQFDHGTEINYLKYGQPSPPNYDLTKFKSYSVKSLMTISNADPFSKNEDCQHLFEHLNPEIFKVLKLDDYNHLDYLWSNHAVYELYVEVLDFLLNK